MSLWELLFGCGHRKLSPVFTIKKCTYRVCLECGKQFLYDWRNMKIIKNKKEEAAMRAGAAKSGPEK